MKYTTLAATAAAILAGLLGASASSAATVSIGGYTFDTTAFPTSASFISGGPPSLSFPSSGNINTDLVTATNSSTSTYIFGRPLAFSVTFGNAPIKNGAGADLVVFELGAPDTVSVTLNGQTKTYLTSYTGFAAAGFNLNASAIDLSDFGTAADGLVSAFTVNNASTVTGSASIAAIGALSTAAIPEPSTWALMIVGLVSLGVAGYGSSRKKATAAA